jgi:hypothetical protein
VVNDGGTPKYLERLRWCSTTKILTLATASCSIYCVIAHLAGAWAATERQAGVARTRGAHFAHAAERAAQAAAGT